MMKLNIMVKNALLTFHFLFVTFASTAYAHGPVAEQAAKAVTKATELFLQSAPTGDFQSVSAQLTGEEQFTVRILLKDKPAQDYWCGLDTKSKPAKWGCKPTAGK